MVHPSRDVTLESKDKPVPTSAQGAQVASGLTKRSEEEMGVGEILGTISSITAALN